MCFKNFLFTNKNLKKSIKIRLKKLKNNEIFRKETNQLETIQSTDHKYDLNCNLENCDLHLQKNAYLNFCEFFFTKPIQIDYFYKDSVYQTNSDQQEQKEQKEQNNLIETNHMSSSCNCNLLPNR